MRPIVLVHGAHVVSSTWGGVASDLRDRDHRVETVDLHRGSLEEDTAAAQKIVDGFGGPVVACGWSYGGMVVTGLDLPEGSHLVYLCAFMPDEGETASGLVEGHPTAFGDLVDLDPSGLLVLPGDGVDSVMWDDASPERAAAARETLCNQAIQPLVEPPARVAWREHPSTYVVACADCVVDPDLQRTMAGRATESVEWDTSHSPMVSRPDMVVDLLDRLARQEEATDG